MVTLVIGLVLGFIAGRWQRRYQRSWQERQVAEVLGRQLNPQQEVLVNNITLKLADGSTTQIDHILLATSGIYVIESKHYRGWIFGQPTAARWTQVVYRQKHQFQNPLRQNYRHQKALEQLFDFLPSEAFKSLVIFSGTAEFKTPMPSNVIQLQQYPAWFAPQRGEQLLSINRVQFCLGRLQFCRLSESDETDSLHRHNLQQRRQPRL
ncbi:nuclease-related domain-containing protein [Ferrimonas senticii]|uniref:nuclease-related domain-containing protein n=1 Tax=Ferrimonas senticii TaxID=394566 RepID=UPI000418D691|nr:nuclease-related domain-containing protein [Ferrimonas senticii]